MVLLRENLDIASEVRLVKVAKEVRKVAHWRMKPKTFNFPTIKLPHSFHIVAPKQQAHQ